MTTLSTLYGLLALASMAAVVFMLLARLAAVTGPAGGGLWRSFRDTLAPLAPGLALLVATVATLGSLTYSEIAGFGPCELCWYQRIAMYPLVVVLGVAAWRRDGQVWRTAVPISVIGAAVSVWHLVIERNPGLAGPCDPAAPCAVRWVEELGVFTLPAMALVGFSAVIVLTLAARPRADA